MGNSSSRHHRQPAARSSIPRSRPVSELLATDQPPDDNHDRPSRIRPRSAYQQDLLQEPWPPQTRPSAPTLSRRRTRLSRHWDDLVPSFSRSLRRNRSPSARRNRLSHVFSPSSSLHPHAHAHALAAPDNDAASPDLLPRFDSGPDFDLSFGSPSPHADPDLPDDDDDDDRDASPGLADRISSLTPARELSRMAASRRSNRSRRRSSRPEETPMSRILTLAAHALAATLTGNNSQTAVEDLRRAASNVDPDDGSLDAFMQFLQSGRLSSHLARSMAAAEERDDASASQPPLDFFRMFQLRNRLQPGNRDSSVSADASNFGDDADEGRMVPILIVGIRSLNHDRPAPTRDAADGSTMPPFFDALARVQSGESSAAAAAQDTLADSLGRPSPRSSRSSRRASYSAFSANTPEGRRQQWIADIGRPRSEVGLPTTSSTPLGPSPPPTTPASAPLSALSSSDTTPSRRVSFAEPGPSYDPSAEHVASPSRSARTSWLGSSSRDDDRPPTPTARRAGRGMDFLRHGSGSARRRGIVGPDRPPSEGNRSWIIYVLGGNYPENHPILSTPSLFTDSPTYEDMLLLSSLIGPAKPPVASAEEVDAAGGLFTVRVAAGRTEAVAADDDEVLLIDPAQTCGICLTAYAHDEVARRLKACSHVFHRLCVDEWLTTGRNSCPLCRVKAVNDKAPAADDSSAGGGPSSPHPVPGIPIE